MNLEVYLKGVHRVKKRLADGSERVYHYAWRGGPQIKAKPGTDEFLTEYTTLKRKHGPAQPKTIGALIEEYRNSSWFLRLSPSGQKSYDRNLDDIRATFGRMKLSALKGNGCRRLFLKWHEDKRNTPRAADMAMTVLRRLLSYGMHVEAIERNPMAQSFERLSKGSRKDIVWTNEQIDKILNKGKPHIRNVVLMALWTMQRQGDLLTMPTISAERDRIRVKQSKTGSVVWVAIPDEIRPIIDQARDAGTFRILSNSHGDPWTSSGFQSSFRKELIRLGIKGVTFNDLRGTSITYCYAMGMDIETIALISGHTKDSANNIIRKNYLAGQEVVEAIRRGRK